MAGKRTKVGCCGFAMAQQKYFDTFALLEVQKTFYKPPKIKTARRWCQQAPRNFEFTVKAWQLITHAASSPTYRRLKNLSETQKKQAGNFRWNDTVRRAWQKVREISEVLKAEKILFQCPPSFEPNDRNKDNLRKFFSQIDRGGLLCIWEPRGKWQPNEISTLCKELDLVHCVDPFKNSPVTRPMRYFRLHGITGYKHKYTDPELRRLERKCPKTTNNYILFNNQSMAEDAARFQQLLDKM